MAEGGPRPGGSAQLLQVAPDAVPGERPQADDDAHAPQQPQLIEPVILAGVALLWGGFFGRWGTADAGVDVAVAETQAVALVSGRGAVGEAGAVQGGELEVAGAVAGPSMRPRYSDRGDYTAPAECE